ncbi:FecR domain-containing protein [Sphingobacterium sp. JB170]|uniref:FecR domain-containing protein n=1 Tax=Sphingobacterium sp. JB170 TaxID=1434842 RepID=UPI00097F5FF8|nr:FecR domain-containing protein [Sphingobacterium sp. JB170]SJN47491.1 putative anti-sigma factor [Sphingobacterium sp. JB170]
MKRKQNLNTKEILERYVNGKSTEQESRLVEKWYNQTRSSDHHFDTELAHRHLAQVWKNLDPSRKKTNVVGFKKIALGAACLAVLLGVGIYLANKYIPVGNRVTERTMQQQANSVNQAILTLADGSIIKLDSLQAGQRVSRAGIMITKQADGTLVYQADNSDVSPGQAKFNTITTPRGKQYTILLPDHSTVWLNAASTIRFPVAFLETRREVELSGEGFFEVASDPKKPFIVTSKNQQTIVRGTKFNINAYPNESKMTTTLLEGSVLVSIVDDRGGNQKQIPLQPNEQLITEGRKFEKLRVDARHFVSWKDGKFIYENSPLAAVMLQLARWYDVEIIYLDDMENISFTGSLSKSDGITDILRKISLTESVHFEIKGRRIMVTR